MDVTFLGPCLYKKKIKELAGSSYKIPRQGKPCRVDNNTWGCDQTDLFPGSWATNSHSALPPSSWLSLMITNGSINLPQAAWESHQDRWDLSSPQKPSEEGFLSFWRRVSELRQKDEQHHFSPACMHTTSESLKPPRCEFASRPGRAGQGFFWERRICDLLHCTGKYSASERQLCLHSQIIQSGWTLRCSESCLTPLQEFAHCIHRERRLSVTAGNSQREGTVPGDWNPALPTATSASPECRVQEKSPVPVLLSVPAPLCLPGSFLFSSALSLVLLDPETAAEPQQQFPAEGEIPEHSPGAALPLAGVMGSSSGRSDKRWDVAVAMVTPVLIASKSTNPFTRSSSCPVGTQQLKETFKCIYLWMGTMESPSRFSGISLQVGGRTISTKQQPRGESRASQEEFAGSMAGMGSVGRGSRNLGLCVCSKVWIPWGFDGSPCSGGTRGESSIQQSCHQQEIIPWSRTIFLN